MKTMIICSLVLILWLYILIVFLYRLIKISNKENSIEKKAVKEAENLLKANKKINLIIKLIQKLESSKKSERNTVRIKILKTKLKLMISNPVVREEVMRIKKIKK